MNSQPFIAKITEFFTQNPGKTPCLDCLGITSVKHQSQIKKHIKSKFRDLFTFETSVCSECKSLKEILRRLNIP